MLGFGALGSLPLGGSPSPAASTEITIGLATETDTALSIAAVRSIAIGLATETDSVLALTLLSGEVVEIGLALETDSALALLPQLIGLATETDTALPLTALQTSYWPFDDIKPRHIGIYPVANPIGGGVALVGREPVIDSGAGYWHVQYGGVYIKNRAQILKMRQLEALFLGRGGTLAIVIYDGKRAPWPGAPGGSLTAIADAAVAVGATSIAIDATGLAPLSVGMGFSVPGHHYHQIKAITSQVGNVYTCTIFPKTREAIADGEDLEFGRPTLGVRLANDNDMAMFLRLLKYGDVDIEFVEDVP